MAYKDLTALILKDFLHIYMKKMNQEKTMNM